MGRGTSLHLPETRVQESSLRLTRGAKRVEGEEKILYMGQEIFLNVSISKLVKMMMSGVVMDLRETTHTMLTTLHNNTG